MLLHPAAIAASLAPCHPGVVTVTRQGSLGSAVFMGLTVGFCFCFMPNARFTAALVADCRVEVFAGGCEDEVVTLGVFF